MKTIKSERINVDKYIGTKVKVVWAKIEPSRFGDVVKLESEPILFKEEDKLPDGKKLTASRIFSIGKDEDNNYAVVEDSFLHTFLKKKDVVIKENYELGDTIKELIGINCLVKKNDKDFLELS